MLARCAVLILAVSTGRAGACDVEGCSWTLGMRLLREGQYEQAIQLFEEGFRHSRNPKFLFEIAESQRLLGRCDEAARSYAFFLRVAPYTANRAETEARLAECRQPPSPATPADKPLLRRPANAAIGVGGAFL